MFFNLTDSFWFGALELNWVFCVFFENYSLGSDSITSGAVRGAKWPVGGSDTASNSRVPHKGTGSV